MFNCFFFKGYFLFYFFFCFWIDPFRWDDINILLPKWGSYFLEIHLYIFLSWTMARYYFVHVSLQTHRMESCFCVQVSFFPSWSLVSIFFKTSWFWIWILYLNLENIFLIILNLEKVIWIYWFEFRKYNLNLLIWI